MVVVEHHMLDCMVEMVAMRVHGIVKVQLCILMVVMVDILVNVLMVVEEVAVVLDM